MAYTNIEKLTMEIIKQCYKGDTTLFFEYLHPDAILLSVGKGQVIEGKEAIKRNITTKMENPIRSDIISMTCKSYTTADRNLYVILQMDVVVYGSDGRVQKVHQRITADWKNFRNPELAGEGVLAGWLFRSIHISVAMEMKTPSITLTHSSEHQLYEETGLMQREKKMGSGT